MRAERSRRRAGERPLRHPRGRVAAGRFAAIWSNPPVRIGKDALHALLGQWLARLSPGVPADSGGSAYMVVARNLGADSLHRWLAGQGWPVMRLAARSGYRLLQVDFRAERAEVTRP